MSERRKGAGPGMSGARTAGSERRGVPGGAVPGAGGGGGAPIPPDEERPPLTADVPKDDRIDESGRAR